MLLNSIFCHDILYIENLKGEKNEGKIMLMYFLVTIVMFVITSLTFKRTIFYYDHSMTNSFFVSVPLTLMLSFTSLVLDTSCDYLFFTGKKINEVHLIYKMVRMPEGYEVYTVENGELVKHILLTKQMNVVFTKSKSDTIGNYSLKGIIKKTNIIRNDYEVELDYPYREFRASVRGRNTLNIELPEGFEYSHDYELEDLMLDDLYHETKMKYGNIDKVVFEDNFYKIYTYKNNRHKVHKIRSCDYIDVKIENKDVKIGTFHYKIEETRSGKPVKSAKGQFLKITLPLNQKVEYN